MALPGSIRMRPVLAPVTGLTCSSFSLTPGATSSQTPSDWRREVDGTTPPIRCWMLIQTDAGGVIGDVRSKSWVRRRDQALTNRQKLGSPRMRLSTNLRSAASRHPSTYSPANSSGVSRTRVTLIETFFQLGEPSADCRFHRAERNRKGLRQFCVRQPELKSHQDRFGLHRVETFQASFDIDRDDVMRGDNCCNFLQVHIECMPNGPAPPRIDTNVSDNS